MQFQDTQNLWIYWEKQPKYLVLSKIISFNGITLFSFEIRNNTL